MNTLALIGGLPGYVEILIVVFVILLFFGPKRLPQLMRSLGKGLNEFKRGQTESLPEEKAETPDKPTDPTEKPEEPKTDA